MSTLASMRALFPTTPPTNAVAGEEHILSCTFCLEPFRATIKQSGKLRDAYECDQLRKALILKPDTDPVVCDICYNTIVGMMNPRVWHTRNLTLQMSCVEATETPKTQTP